MDSVLADPTTVADTEELTSAVASWGSRLVIADVARGDGTPRHDPERLASAYHRILSEGRSGDAEAVR